MFFDDDRSPARPTVERIRLAGRAAAVVGAVACIGLGGLLAAREVRVEQGDTVSAIARRHGSTVAAVTQANRLVDPNLIRVGQVLVVPATPASAGPAPQGATVHVVQPGESLWGIARRTGSTVAAIAQANGITDPARVLIGSTLTIPAGAAPAVAAAPLPPTPVPPAVSRPAGTPSRNVSVSYVVRQGDSVSSIATRFGVSMGSIRRTNGLTTDSLKVGQRLVVPLS
jgi:N-acetylmuramoyl-L-alanine amidase